MNIKYFPVKISGKDTLQCKTPDFYCLFMYWLICEILYSTKDSPVISAN